MVADTRKQSDRHGAKTLERGLRVLEALADACGTAGVTEIAARCGLDKTTAHRLLATLVRSGYARRDVDTRAYSLGLKVFDLYDGLQAGLGLQEICRPHLARLNEISGETSHLAVLAGTDIMFVDWVNTKEAMGVRTTVGRKEPAFCTALGRAMLAAMPNGERQRILADSELRAYTSRTLITISEIEADLVADTRRGYALDNEEFLVGVRCIAAPVLGPQGEVAAAMGVSGPAARMKMSHCRKLGPPVGAIAAEASAALGYRRPGNEHGA